MNAKLKIGGVWAVILATVGLLVAGCASAGPQAPPTAFDKAVLDVTTNVVTVTNLVTVTNTSYATVTTTNTVGQLVTVTNVVQIPELVPMVVTNTTYNYAPKASIVDTANMLGPLAGPWGALAATALAGVLGIFAKAKSSQASTMEAVAANSQQALATARSVIAAIPNNQAITASFNSWLAAHQADTDIAKELATVVDDYVDPSHHATVAAGIVAQATTPLPGQSAKVG